MINGTSRIIPAADRQGSIMITRAEGGLTMLGVERDGHMILIRLDPRIVGELTLALMDLSKGGSDAQPQLVAE